MDRPIATASEGMSVTSQVNTLGERLPLEIMTYVAQYLSRYRQSKALAALSATSKKYYDTLLPVLYRRIIISDVSVKLIHRLYDEVLAAYPTTDSDFDILRPFRFAWSCPDAGRDMKSPTSAIDRFKMVEIIEVEGGIQTAVRSGDAEEAGGFKRDVVVTGIPALCPKLRCLVFPQAFIDRARRNEIRKKGREGYYWWKCLLVVSTALEALLQPHTVCLHLGGFESAEACDDSNILHTLIEAFRANSMRRRSLVFHNAPTIPAVSLIGSSDLHFRPSHRLDREARCVAAMEALVCTIRYMSDFTGRIIMHERSPLDDLKCLDERPYRSMADAYFANLDSVLDVRKRHVPEGLAGEELDELALSRLDSPILQDIWTTARERQQRCEIKSWVSWGDFRFSWARFFNVMQTRLAVIQDWSASDRHPEAEVMDTGERS